MRRAVVSLISLMMACGQGALAQEETPSFEPQLEVLPALYSVTNIGEGSILNVRAEPSVSSRDIGDLPFGKVVEATTFDTSGVWARIVWDDGNGWVHRGFLAAVATPMIEAVALPQNMSCFGTEPFWQFSVKDGVQTSFEAAGAEVISEPLISAAPSANHILRLGLASKGWRALVQKKTCSDGMSDRLYGLQIDLMGVGEGRPAILSGCCQISVE